MRTHVYLLVLLLVALLSGTSAALVPRRILLEDASTCEGDCQKAFDVRQFVCAARRAIAANPDVAARLTPEQQQLYTREFFEAWALAMSGEKHPVAQFFLATDLATRANPPKKFGYIAKLSNNCCFWRQGPFTPILVGEIP
jgi:hypothetical protein